MNYILNRLREASTWRGIVMLLAGALGFDLGTNSAELAIAIGVAASGAVGALFPDANKK
ncbi:hypothetical protein [Serratia sp. UGAL515B_01]|uniref:hypothetical protein n=1 Tax=Serratia sp. UGAL515B_01 TaxID=2986763 RepID=UPI0029531CFA|nr:hypothetical protein [Serratia sp. UGAL515B_01]WON77568.1 hypothetical protein OK023_02345 [Serratia sp. UGAL515B_01]